MPRAVGIGLALLLTTVAVYAQVTGFDFVALDDDVYVSANPVVRSGLTAEGLAWAFSTRAQGNWHPLTWLSHMLDCEVGGLDPSVHHASSLVLHGINGVLLYAFLLTATGRLWPSAVAALFFALHPLNVESVVWVAERKTVLCMTFGLLSSMAYLAYARTGGVLCYLGSMLCLGLGLMAKPMLVTLPFTFMLLDYWPLLRVERGRLRRLVVEKLPLLLLSGLSSVVTFRAQALGGAVVGTTGELSFASRLANAAVSYVRYLQKLVWPADLALYYQHPNAPGGVPWSVLQVLGAGALLVGLTLGVWLLRRRRYLGLAWLWYLGTMVPMIGLVQVGEQAMADRYAYLPLVGLFVGIVWGVLDLAPSVSTSRSRVQILVGSVAALALSACAWSTWQQTRYWRDSIALFQRGLVFSPESQTLNFNLGTALESRGRFAEALTHYRRALEVGSVTANEHWGLASALRGAGRLEEAIGHFREALAIDPTNSSLHSNLAETLALTGRLDEAVRHYEAALADDPTRATLRGNLGSALLGLGQPERAIQELAEAVRLDPTFPEGHNNLAVALVRTGDAAQALIHFREAARLRPSWHVPWSSAAHILATNEDPTIRDPREAIRLAQKATALAGEQDPWSLDTLAAAYAADGQYARAILTGERGLEAAMRAGLVPLADELRERLERYRLSSAAGAGHPGD